MNALCVKKNVSYLSIISCAIVLNVDDAFQSQRESSC